MDVDHYLAPPMVPLLELSAAWQLTPAQGGVGHCNHSMSCLYFTVSDPSGQIFVIRDKSRDRSCPVHWAANIILVP